MSVPVFRRFRLCHLISLALCLGAPLAAAQQGPPSEVLQANRLVQAGDLDSAITILEAFFRRTPSATSGRLLLGNAYRQRGDLDRALAAYEQVTTPRPARLQAKFNAAAIHAAKGHADTAFALLAQLKATGAFDMDLVRTTAAFAALDDDPRLDAVSFHPDEFQDPFVEPVRVIHEWDGETKGDQFGWIARDVGDVDGDGVHDAVMSAPSYGAQGGARGEGRVYVYSGRTGTLVWAATGEAGESLGIGLEGAGDVNADGVPDVVAGAPGSGKAYVFSGRDGSVLLSFAGTDPNEGFGRSTSGAGDQNADGHADVIVGAPGSNAAGPGAGRAYVFSGKDGTTLLTLDGDSAGHAFGSIVAAAKASRGSPLLVGAPGAGPSQAGRVYVFRGLSPTPAFVIEADATGSALGAMFTSVVGDVDGDGVPDVYAADFGNAAKGASTGRVYVHSGATGQRLFLLTGEQAGDGFGIGSADVGDVDGDGNDDLLVGAWQYPNAAPSGGKVYLYSGKNGELLRAVTGRIPGETFGFDATGIGDVDGDGVVDLLLTSAWSNVNGYRSGRVFVLSGR